LRLERPEPLRRADGTELVWPIPYQHGFEVADWNGDGAFDILTNEQRKLYVYLNEGTNARPRLRREALRVYGEHIELSHHETSIKVVDWDGRGSKDLICGAESGWTYFFRRAALDSAQRPAYSVH
jgi:hypothetical protein